MSSEDKLARYDRLLTDLQYVQRALWARVEMGMMTAGCGVMASLTKCHFWPQDDDSVTLMLNYCCFNVRYPDNSTLVDQYIAGHQPEDEDLKAVLEAHQRSYFSVFEVLSLIPGVGLVLRDLFGEGTIELINPRMADSLQPGFVLPIRVMPLGDFHVFFNGPIPVLKVASVQQYEDSLFATYGKHGVQKGRPLTDEERAQIETFQTLRILADRHPELLGKPKPAAPAPPAVAPAPRFGARPLPGLPRAGRNDLCPCGSGKKFKNCCLARN